MIKIFYELDTYTARSLESGRSRKRVWSRLMELFPMKLFQALNGRLAPSVRAHEVLKPGAAVDLGGGYTLHLGDERRNFFPPPTPTRRAPTPASFSQRHDPNQPIFHFGKHSAPSYGKCFCPGMLLLCCLSKFSFGVQVLPLRTLLIIGRIIGI